jgi:ParB family transcriptional regulator, chromosome partitioning protein
MNTVTPIKPKAGKSSLGLENMGDLSSLLDAPIAADGTPSLLQLDLIDEDPGQPRKEKNKGYSKEKMEELENSIKARGVKTPISVRKNPNSPGRYIINHGARRVRASRNLGLKTIPYVLDEDYTRLDQIVENLQREDLNAMEIATIIGFALKEGIKKKDIAIAMGKSNTFVTMHTTLLDLPDYMSEIYHSGRCSDVTLIYELTMVGKKHPDELKEWLQDETMEEITRVPVKLFREYLAKKYRDNNSGDNDVDNNSEAQNNDDQDLDSIKEKGKKQDDPAIFKKAIIKVYHNERDARLLVNRRPPLEGYAWLKYDDDGHEVEADLREVSLIAVIEG